MRKLYFLFILLWISSVPIGAQMTQYAYNYLPVSASTENLMRRVQSPVNYLTGALDLSIPLYIIRTKDLTLPITLKCNTTGIKPTDIDGLAGQGWDIDYGPSVGQQIQGMPDEEGYLHYNSDWGRQDRSYLDQVAKGQHHTKPDIFFYSTLSSNGRFVFKRPRSSSENNKYTPIFFPYNGDSVKVGNSMYSFEIKDTEGTSYNYYTCEQSPQYITGWKVDQITSKNGECISFTYKDVYQLHDTYVDHYEVEDGSQDSYVRPPGHGYWKGVNGVKDFWEYVGTESYPGVDTLYARFQLVGNDPSLRNQPCQSRTVTPVRAKFPSAIYFGTGRVEFIYNNKNLLTRMEVYEDSGSLLQTISFQYTLMYTGEGQDKNLLKKLTFKDEVTGKTKNYSMEYFNFGSVGPNTKAIDYWGYYNNHTENTDLVPRHTIPITDRVQRWTTVYARIGGADRTPNLFARNHTIRSITYPNGGREEFDYALNQCDIGGGVALTPGLRIERIRYYDAGNVLRSDRRLTYTLSTANVNNALPQFMIEQNKVYVMGEVRTYQHRLRTFYSQPVANGYIACGIPTLYSEVVEHDEMARYPMPRHTYKYDTYNCSFPSNSNNILVNHLQDFKGKNRIHESKRNISTMFPLFTVENSYATTSVPGRYETEVHDVFPNHVFVYDGSMPSNTFLDTYSNFASVQYNLTGNQRVVLESKSELGYGTTIQPEIRTDYTYGRTLNDIKTALPIETRRNNSDGSTHITRYQYPYHVSGTVHNRMVSMNDMKRPVSIQEFKDDTETSHVMFDYVNNPSNTSAGAVLSAVKYKDMQTGGIKVFEEYTRHDDRGNVCEFYKENRTPVTLLWGNDYTRLVGIIEGETYNEVMRILGISYLQLQNSSDEDILQKMEGVRLALAEAHVTTFLHDPSGGVKCIVSPNGNKVTNKFNGFGSLVESRDYENALLLYNDYYYK